MSARKVGWVWVGLVLLSAAPRVARAQALDDRLCSRWTQWIPPRSGDYAVLFSFRMCQLPSARALIEWRWANTTQDDVTFFFQLYSIDPGACDKKPGRSFASGKHTVRGGHYEDFSTGRRRVGAMEFSNLQLYWCVVPDQ